MQPMRWTVLIRYEGAGQDGELRDVGCFVRPVDRAAPADFGLWECPKLPSRSRGTSMRSEPVSVSTVLPLVEPVRNFVCEA
jgi:hypothetical protein